MPSLESVSLARLRRGAFAALALGLSGPALAAWDLDAERSTVQFLSVKNASVAEVHHFTEVSGGIDDDGQATVTIDLASVETISTAVPVDATLVFEEN